ncbi:MAG: TonB-dependent receptor plug domain-containing protein, partial [Muribaculaceae bacterium]|nr:TonB-dependent receptor plug domain-containing protein [Muribaculaceae bacterium]
MSDAHHILRPIIIAAAALGATTHVAATGRGHAEADTLMSLREVTVTAIKGGSLANADQAVTYIGRTAVENLGLVNMKQAGVIAPNFYIPDYGSRMTSTIYVRGLGTRIDQPVVGLNVDNVPIVNKDNYDFDMADIERIEMLRGPQNILYGRNTMAGLINIYTVSPLSFEGVRLSGSYGSHNTFRASGSFYRRLLPTLGMSLTAYGSGTDGCYRNTYNDTPAGQRRDWSVRWRTAWRPASNVIFENAATLSGSRQSGYAYAPAGTKVINYNDTCFYRRLAFTDGLTVKHSFAGIDFSSIISFQYINDNMTLDQDFMPVDYFTLSQIRHEWAMTADFVARGRHGAWHWLAGLYAFGRQGEMSAPVCFGDYGISQLIEKNANAMAMGYPLRWDDRSLLLRSRFTLPSGGMSAYHQSELRLGRWSLTGALRFDWEHVGIDYHSSTSTSYTIYEGDPSLGKPYMQVPVEIDDRGTLGRDFCQLLPKVAVSYRLLSRRHI